jgi:hypothetical protein
MTTTVTVCYTFDAKMATVAKNFENQRNHVNDCVNIFIQEKQVNCK